MQVQSLGSGRSPREGHGSPLQYSCLENPMDRQESGGLQSIRVTKTRTWLEWLSLHALMEFIGQFPRIQSILTICQSVKPSVYRHSFGLHSPHTHTHSHTHALIHPAGTRWACFIFFSSQCHIQMIYFKISIGLSSPFTRMTFEHTLKRF